MEVNIEALNVFVVAESDHLLLSKFLKELAHQ